MTIRHCALDVRLAVFASNQKNALQGRSLAYRLRCETAEAKAEKAGGSPQSAVHQRGWLYPSANALLAPSTKHQHRLACYAHPRTRRRGLQAATQTECAQRAKRSIWPRPPESEGPHSGAYTHSPLRTTSKSCWRRPAAINTSLPLGPIALTRPQEHGAASRRFLRMARKWQMPSFNHQHELAHWALRGARRRHDLQPAGVASPCDNLSTNARCRMAVQSVVRLVPSMDIDSTTRETSRDAKRERKARQMSRG